MIFRSHFWSDYVFWQQPPIHFSLQVTSVGAWFPNLTGAMGSQSGAQKQGLLCWCADLPQLNSHRLMGWIITVHIVHSFCFVLFCFSKLHSHQSNCFLRDRVFNQPELVLHWTDSMQEQSSGVLRGATGNMSSHHDIVSTAAPGSSSLCSSHSLHWPWPCSPWVPWVWKVEVAAHTGDPKLLLLFFCLFLAAPRGILVPWHRPLALEAWSLNHWITRQVPQAIS